jgi:ATP-dependent Clp protease adapter protein ClpS
MMDRYRVWQASDGSWAAECNVCGQHLVVSGKSKVEAEKALILKLKELLEGGGTAVEEKKEDKPSLDAILSKVFGTPEAPKPKNKVYSVKLYNDNKHSFQHVIGLLAAVCGLPVATAAMLATAIDKTGKAVVHKGSKKECEHIVWFLRKKGGMQAEMDEDDGQ